MNDRDRALDLLRRHGWTTVSFQTLEPDFQYWFGDDDAMVAYVDTGGAWVAGGAPIADGERLAEVAAAFIADARDAGRRACFFACEARFRAAVDAPIARIGEQPVWDPARWDDTLRGCASLRYQLRRAAHKGVTVRPLAPAEVAPGTAVRAALDAMIERWLARRGMAPMRFLVQVAPFERAEERVLLAAERDGALVGFAAAVPVYARRRLFVEDLVRDATAPNGTAELLVDAAMRAAVARGDAAVTLGLAPLAGDVAPWLRLARRLSTPLYDFRGLQAFKAKLRPHAWEPVYLAAAPGGSRVLAMYDSLGAFAGGSLLRFGARTLARRRQRRALPAGS